MTEKKRIKFKMAILKIFGAGKAGRTIKPPKGVSRPNNLFYESGRESKKFYEWGVDNFNLDNPGIWDKEVIDGHLGNEIPKTHPKYFIILVRKNIACIGKKMSENGALITDPDRIFGRVNTKNGKKYVKSLDRLANKYEWNIWFKDVNESIVSFFKKLRIE